jgi:hypothetical protein
VSDTDDQQFLTLGDFSATVSADAGVGSPSCTPSADSQATQMSSVTSDEILASGSSSSGAGFASSASADSTLSATITLTSPVAYSISGTLSGQTNDFFEGQTTAGKAKIKLTQDTTTIFELTQSSAASEPFSLTGLLSPSVYTLEAVAPSNAIQNLSGTSAYDFTFSIPEPSCGLLTSLACLGLIFVSRHERRSSRKRRSQA